MTLLSFKLYSIINLWSYFVKSILFLVQLPCGLVWLSLVFSSLAGTDSWWVGLSHWADWESLDPGPTPTQLNLRLDWSVLDPEVLILVSGGCPFIICSGCGTQGHSTPLCPNAAFRCPHLSSSVFNLHAPKPRHLSKPLPSPAQLGHHGHQLFRKFIVYPY